MAVTKLVIERDINNRNTEFHLLDKEGEPLGRVYFDDSDGYWYARLADGSGGNVASETAGEALAEAFDQLMGTGRK